jgi:hypothetical protein
VLIWAQAPTAAVRNVNVTSRAKIAIARVVSTDF